MKEFLNYFYNKFRSLNSKKSRRLDVANLPFVDRIDFSNLSENGTFGKYKKLAIELNNNGFTKLEISDSKWLDILDDVNKDIFTLVDTNNISDRFQDAWLSYGLDSVRQTACHPEILTALKTIFGREAFPFQTLNFIKGSVQNVHSDAAHFHSFPHGFMCGIWIALEDVSKDSGPLFFYAGSHRLPYLSARDLNLSVEQIKSHPHPQVYFEETWNDYINEFSFKKSLFLAKRGDVLIWHSNLLHGGSPIENFSLTRKSQVSHYYFRGCEYKRPFWDCTDSFERKWFIPNDLTLGK